MSTTAPVFEDAEKGSSLWHDAWLRLRKNELALFGGGVLLFMVVVALLTPWIAPYSYEAQNLDLGASPPSATHWLGTDIFGRDVLTQIMYGGRISCGRVHCDRCRIADWCHPGCGGLCRRSRGRGDDAPDRHSLRLALYDFYRAADGRIRAQYSALVLRHWCGGMGHHGTHYPSQVQSLRQQEFVEAADGGTLLQRLSAST